MSTSADEYVGLDGHELVRKMGQQEVRTILRFP